MTPADAYLASLAPSTQRVAASDLRQLDRLSPGWQAFDVPAAVELRAAVARTYRPSTGRRLLAVARGVVRCAWKLGLIDADRRDRVTEALPRLAGGRIERGRTLGWGDVLRLLQRARSPQERALLAVLAGGGLRRSEAAGLTWGRVGSRAGAMYLRVLGKGNKERLLRLPTWAADLVQSWRGAQRYLQPASQVFPRWATGDAIHEVVRAAGQRIGIPDLAPHDLRRTYFGLCRASGLDLATIARSMGHADVSTTVKYDRRTDDEVQSAMAALDDTARLTRTPTATDTGGEGT